MPEQSTELQPFMQRGTIALKSAASLKEVAEAVLDEEVPGALVTMDFPPVAPVVVITPEDEQALLALPRVFGKVQPETRRTLTDEEKTALYDEQQVLKTIAALLKGREEAIKTSVRHHLDVDAEERGVAVPKAVVRGGKTIVEASPRDSAGHYVLGKKDEPERTPIPGTNQAWSREMRSGGMEINGSDLETLLEQGEIDRKTYLSMTREVRVFDPARTMEALKKDPSLLAVIRKISRRTGVSSALFVRKAK